MSKDRISATVDESVSEQLERDSINASGLVNKLLKQYFASGGQSQDMLKLRERQLLSDIESLESKLATKQDELELVQSELAEIRKEKRGTREEVFETLENVPWEESNPAIQQRAEELGMKPAELIDRLEDYHA